MYGLRGEAALEFKAPNILVMLLHLLELQLPVCTMERRRPPPQLMKKTGGKLAGSDSHGLRGFRGSVPGTSQICPQMTNLAQKDLQFR